MNLSINFIYKINKNNICNKIKKYFHINYKNGYIKTKRFYSTNVDTNTKHKANWGLHTVYIMVQPDSESPMAQFIVSYIDTSKGLDSLLIKNQPIAMFLHDCLSTIDTFKPIFNRLIENGYRIIIPSLVGEGQTKGVTEIDECIFEKQMLGERTIFLIQFLQNIQIKRISVAIGHGISCLNLLAMGSVAKLPFTIERILFLNSIPAHKPPRWVYPHQLSFLMLKSYDYFFLRPLFLLWLKSKAKANLLSYTDNPENLTLNNILHILRITHGIRFDNIANIVAAFLFNKLPLMSISCHEEMSNYVLMVEYMKLFNLAPKHLIEYSKLPKVIESKEKDQEDIELPLGQFIVLPGKFKFPINADYDLNIVLDEIFLFLNCKKFR